MLRHSRNHNNEPPVVILCAGLAAKTLVVVLRPLINKGWQFIDVGTQLDGFGGKKSRDYIDIAEMCKRAFEYKSERPSNANAGTPHDIGGLDAINNYWFAPGVCNIHIKKMFVDNNNKVKPVSRSNARFQQEQEQEQHKRQHYHRGHPFMQKRGFSHAARRGNSSNKLLRSSGVV